MKPGIELAAIHPAVEAGVNNQDIDGLMALYAEDANMMLVDGSVAQVADPYAGSEPEELATLVAAVDATGT